MATPELPALKAYLPRLVDKHLDLDFIRKNASSCNARTRATRRSNPGMRFKHRRSARPALNAATAPVISSNSARPPRAAAHRFLAAINFRRDLHSQECPHAGRTNTKRPMSFIGRFDFT